MLKRWGKPWIIAHRGYRACYPENTLAAFEAAIALGVPMTELDVQFSRDRLPVVVHDERLERTTNGRGKVAEHTLDRLKALDAGGWFDPRFADERIPTLAEVLQHCAGRVLLNIEIKAVAYEPRRPSDAIERQVVELVRAHGLEQAVLISSFEPQILTRIAEAPNPPALALITGRRQPISALERCLAIKAYSWHPSCRGLTQPQVARMQAAGMRVMPYTVNTSAQMRRMMALGVDGVFSDDPLGLQVKI